MKPDKTPVGVVGDAGPVGAAGPVGGLMPELSLDGVRDYIEKCLEALTGEFELKEGIAKLHLGEEINLRIRRVADQVVLEFRDPAPMLEVHYGLNFTRRITGVAVDTESIVIEIDKFPDFTLKVKS